MKWSEGSSYPDPDGSGNFVADLTGNVPKVVVLFGVNKGAGTVANDAALRVPARAASVVRCKVTVTASDATVDFQFRIKQNGTDIFSTDPTVTHGAAAGSVSTFTGLTSNPLIVADGDVFSFDILAGSASWALVIQLES